MSATGAININTSGSAITNFNTGTSTGTVNIGNNTGNTAVNIDSGTSAINIGTGAQARTTNIATGAASQTLNLGSTTGASPVVIQSGASGVLVKGANTSSAFQIQNSGSNILFSADTLNTRLTVNNNIASLTSFTAGSPLGTPRWGFGAVAVNGYIYAVGYGSTTEYVKIKADGSLGTWTPGLSTNTSRSATAGAVVSHNDYIYVVGGSNGVGLNTVEEFEN